MTTMQAFVQKINQLKDWYGLSWQYGSDLPTHQVSDMIWFKHDGTFLARLPNDPYAMCELLETAISDHQLPKRPYYPPLKKAVMLASKVEYAPHLVEVERDCVIPDDPTHPSSFAHVRTHHVHEGVDLYAEEGDPVYAMVNGVITNIIQHFTGEGAGSPWWNHTQAVVIEDANGVWMYGEIIADQHLSIGGSIAAGQLVGHVTPVLKTNKGYPTSMLHLERYIKGTTESIGLWAVGTSQPEGLLDPTPELITGLLL